MTFISFLNEGIFEAVMWEIRYLCKNHPFSRNVRASVYLAPGETLLDPSLAPFWRALGRNQSGRPFSGDVIDLWLLIRVDRLYLQLFFFTHSIHEKKGDFPSVYTEAWRQRDEKRRSEMSMNAQSR